MLPCKKHHLEERRNFSIKLELGLKHFIWKMGQAATSAAIKDIGRNWQFKRQSDIAAQLQVMALLFIGGK